MSGFEPDVADVIGGGFRDSGFTPGHHRWRRRPARRSSRPARCARATRSACRSIGGDLEMGATGTVTHIDGDRVYAFGHPFFNLGPAAVPDDARVRLHDAPQPDVSFKISSHGRGDRDDAAGSRDGDRGNAGQGTGAGADDRSPSTRPATATRSRSAARSSCNLVNDQLFTPLLAYVSLFNTLGALRAPVRRRDVRGEEPRAAQGARRPDARGRVRRREPDPRRLDGGRRAADDDARRTTSRR